MNQKEKHYRVGLFGHYGQNNLGDEAVILSAIQNLRNRIPNIELIGFSLDPCDTYTRHNIESFPIRYEKSYFVPEQNRTENLEFTSKVEASSFRRHIKNVVRHGLHGSQATAGFLNLIRNLRSEIGFLFEIRKQLQNLDVLIICGSNQLEDTDLGPWGYPYTILKWVLLAKKTGTKIFFVGVGAGPINYSLSDWMFKKALSHSSYLSYRDYSSKKMIDDHIPGLEGLIYQDLAHSLKMLPSRPFPQKEQKTVAINLMPAFDKFIHEGRNQKKYEVFLNHMASFTIHILNKGFSVTLYNNHTKDLLVIDDLIEKLQELSDVNMEKVSVKRNETVQDLIDTISEAKLIVAMRFHSTVLPLSFGKPVLGICYHRKSKDLLEEAGLEDYYVDVNSFTHEELSNKFDALCENITAVKRKIEFRYKDYAESLDEQWDRVAKLIKT